MYLGFLVLACFSFSRLSWLSFIFLHVVFRVFLIDPYTSSSSTSLSFTLFPLFLPFSLPTAFYLLPMKTISWKPLAGYKPRPFPTQYFVLLSHNLIKDTNESHRYLHWKLALGLLPCHCVCCCGCLSSKIAVMSTA